MKKFKIFIFLFILFSFIGIALSAGTGNTVIKLTFDTDKPSNGTQDANGDFKLNSESSDGDWYGPNKPFKPGYLAGKILTNPDSFDGGFTCSEDHDDRLKTSINKMERNENITISVD